MARVLADPRIFRHLDEDPSTEAQLLRRYTFLQHGWSPDRAERWLTWILRLNGAGPDADPVGFVQATIRAAADGDLAPGLGAPDGQSRAVPGTTDAPGLVADIAYVLAPAHWGAGLGTEAVTALLDTVFDHWPVIRAVAEIDIDNAPSIGLVVRLGFTLERTVTPEPAGGPADLRAPSPEHVYALSASRWASRRSGRPRRPCR